MDHVIATDITIHSTKGGGGGRMGEGTPSLPGEVRERRGGNVQQASVGLAARRAGRARAKAWKQEVCFAKTVNMAGDEAGPAVDSGS